VFWNLPHKASRRVGRRGAFLLFLAILDGCYSYALLALAVAPLRNAPDMFLPVQAWGCVWAAGGLVCMTGAWLQTGRDRVCFAFAAGVKAAWALLYLELWLGQGFADDWISVVVWASFSLTILLISGWPEVPAVRRE
jgi:hypothetical protein